MKVNEGLKINCNVEITKQNIATGEIREIVRRHNIVTDVGLNELKNFLMGTPTEFTHLAVGTGTTTETASDTALETEQFRDTVTNRNDVDTGEMKFEYFLSSSDANGYDLSEAGIFDASSGGNMLARVTHPPDSKTNSEAWTYSWTFTIARA